MENNEIILYQPDDTLTLDVRVEDESVWLTQAQMSELFQATKQNISLHIRNIYKEGELAEEVTVKEYLTVQKEGNRNVQLHNYEKTHDRFLIIDEDVYHISASLKDLGKKRKAFFQDGGNDRFTIDRKPIE